MTRVGVGKRLFGAEPEGPVKRRRVSKAEWRRRNGADRLTALANRRGEDGAVELGALGVLELVQRVGGSDRRRARAMAWAIYDRWPGVEPGLSGGGAEPPDEVRDLYEACSEVLDAAGAQTRVDKGVLAIMRNGKL